MFGSDWPVALLGAESYSEVVHLAEQVTSEFSEGEQERFWALNALEKYKITNL